MTPGWATPDEARRRVRSTWRLVMRAIGWVLLTAYGLFVRFAVFIAAIWGGLYFLIASQPFKAWVEQLVSENMPGAISCATVRWGPNPWEIAVTDGRIHGARGEEVVRVEGVRARIDMGRMLLGLARFIDDPAKHPFPLYVDFAEVVDAWAAIRVDAEGRVGFVEAFDHPDFKPGAPGVDDAPLNFDMHVAAAVVHGGSGVVEAPGFTLEAAGLDATTDFHVTGDAVIAFTPDIVSVDTVSAYFHTFQHLPEDLVLKAHDVVVEGFDWDGDIFSWRRVEAGLGENAVRAHGRIEGRGGMDVAPDDPTWHGEATVVLGGASPVVHATTHGALDGPMTIRVAGSGDISKVRAAFSVESEAMRIGSWTTGALTARGRFEPRVDPVDDDVHAVILDEVSAELGTGHVRLNDLAWEPAGEARGSARDVDFAWCLERVRFGDLAPEVMARMTLAMPFVADWSLDGCGTFGLRTSAITAREWLEVDMATLAATPLEAPAAMSGEWRISGRLLRFTDPAPDGGFAPVDHLDISGLVIDRGEDRFRAAGRIDLVNRRFDLEPYLRLGQVSRIAAAAGIGDIRGRFVLKSMRLAGSFDAPRLRGTMNWTQAVLDGRELGTVSGGLDFEGGWLAFNNLRSSNGYGGFELDGRVALLEEGRPSPSLPFEIRKLRVSELALPRLTGRLGPRAVVDVDGRAISGELMRPIETGRGIATVVLRRGEVEGEPFDEVRADLNIAPGDVRIEKARVTWAAGPAWGGQLAVDPRRGTLRGTLHIEPTSLAGLATLRRQVPGLSGLVQADLTVGGSIDAPHLVGTIAVLDLAWDDILVGSATLNVRSTGRGELDISTHDSAFFRGFELKRATLELDRFNPTRLRVLVGMDGLSPGDFLPALRMPGYRFTWTSELSLDADLRAGTTAFALAAPPGGVRMAAPARNQAWSNLTALQLGSDGRRVELQPVSIGLEQSKVAPLQLCGSWVPRRGLDVRATGVLDLGLFPGLDELLSTRRGQLEIATALDHPAANAGSCFPERVPELYIVGDPTAPTLAGRLVTGAIDLMFRGSGRAMRLEPGGVIAFEPGTRGADVDMRIDSDHPLEIALDDGGARVDGTVGFRALRPVRASLRVLGSDIFVQSAGEFALTMSPDVRVDGKNLDTTPDVAVEGTLNLSDGRFYKSFDVLSQAVGDALSGRGDVYSRSLLDAIPWLQTARLAVDIKAEDFQIQTALPLARTDLPARFDLSLRGTIARPTLFRRIDLLPGGQLTYFVFERAFRVTTGAIDFDGPLESPIIDVTAQTPIAYLARASTDALDEEEREVMVTLRVVGRVPDLKIELSADDATLDQTDIQSLLLTGKPRGDLDRAQESRVVSADLAGVINGLLSAPFVRTASVGVGQKGAMEYRVGTCFAPNLCFDTTTVADDTETTLRARFSLLLGDNLVCEGTLRRSDGATTTNQQTYQARCRYRIPLR